ncbi:MAG: Gfo/Idh/MocA family oxidoreductase [Pseudomonadota bacterium]
MLKIACLGAGYFSQFHFDAWNRVDGAEIVGVSNRDRAKAQATGLPVFETLEELLERTAPDVLDVIVSPEGHAEAITTALKHPLKAIICQKPFCRSIAEAREMVTLARDAGIPLIIHENFRFQPWYRAIAKQIDRGAIGRVLQATFRLRPGDGQGPDAYLARQPYFQKMERFLIHETGVHLVDTFRYLFGDPTDVYADLRRVNAVIAGEDAGYVMLDHPNGVRSIFDGNRCLDHEAHNTRCTMGEGLFEGTEGTLTLTGNGAVHLRKFGKTGGKTVLAADQSPNFGGDCTYLLIAHVVDALNGRTAFENTAADYLTVMDVEEAIYRSSETQSKLTLSPP